MKLTPEEIKEYEEIKRMYMLTTIELATILICDPNELLKCSLGQESHPEVVQAVRGWIA